MCVGAFSNAPPPPSCCVKYVAEWILALAKQTRRKPKYYTPSIFRSAEVFFFPDVKTVVRLNRCHSEQQTCSGYQRGKNISFGKNRDTTLVIFFVLL
jgi:hypothetical protein